MVALGMFTFATPLLGGDAVTVTTNNSGSLLTTAASVDVTATEAGALTMISYDAAAPRHPTTEATVASPMSSPSLAVVDTNYYGQPATYASVDWSNATVLHGEDGSASFSDVTPVPEPSTWLAALLASGAALFAAWCRARRDARLVPARNR